MVFYGKKKVDQEQQSQQYRSIKEQILKELGERTTPVYEKSLATIFADVGGVILTGTQSILSLPDKFKYTQLYKAYDADLQYFNQQIREERDWYGMLSRRVTQNKFYIIKHYSCESRMFFLNSLVFASGLLAMGLTNSYSSKMRRLFGTCLFGYGLGGVFVVPEIYNSLILPQTVVQ